MAASSPHPCFYGVPAEIISQLCGVSLRQARAYRSGKSQPHPAVVQLVTLHSQGRILGDAWAGWSARDDKLNDPEGHCTSQGMLRAYAYVWQLARELASQDPVAMSALDRVASIAYERERKRGRGASGATARPAPGENPERDALRSWRDLDPSDPAHPPRKRA